MCRCQIKPTRGRQRNRLEKRCLQMRKRPLRIQRKRKKEKWPHQRKKVLFSSDSGKYFSLSSICLIISSYLVPQLIHHPPMLPAAWRQAILKRRKTKYTKNMQLHKIMKVSKICKSKDLGVLNDQIMLFSLFSSICCSSTVSLGLF